MITAAKPSRSRVWLIVLAFLAPAVFALSTNNIWEDFFITYRCSLNLVHGNGLVYEAGRVVHAFTSPLGTLLPAAISGLLRTDDPQTVIDVFRGLACLSLAGAFALAAGRITSPVALATTAGLWLLDGKLAAFSTNGMETAILVLFVLLAWRGVVDANMRLTGLALAGAMWTRPDGFIFVGALAAAQWFLQRGWRVDWAGWLRVAVWGGCLYTPWFVWAWWYYGSPVPHTIIAKSSLVFDGAANLAALASYPFRLLFGRTAADDSFLPPYFYLGGWPTYLWAWSKILTLGALAAAGWRGCARPARIAGLAFVLGGFYLEITPRAPWYFPAWQVLAYIAVGGLAAAGLEVAAGFWRRSRAILVGGGVALLVLTQGAVFIAVSIQLREQSRLIEQGLRTTLGHDLRRLAAGKKETVFLEPLGYIGYYSGLSMRDTPGLCSPEVVALRRSGISRLEALANALPADWVVLRGMEFAGMSRVERDRFEQHYELIGQYDARAQIESVEFLPGRGFLLLDSYFLLWRRGKSDASPATETVAR